MSLDSSQAYAWTGHVLAALRTALDEAAFLEILPAILSKRFEPGARHTVAVLGDRALPAIRPATDAAGRPAVSAVGADHYYLPVSHCVEKQLALEHRDRVYCIAPCVRLLMDGEDRSGRHLYTFFQVEIEWRTNSVEDVLASTERMLARFSGLLAKRIEGTVLADEQALERIASLAAAPFARIPFGEARDAVEAVGGKVNPHAAGDLTHAEEEALSRSARSPFWLTEYPEGVRDSIYHRMPSGMFATYDLILPMGYGEVATGGLRPASGAEVRDQARKLGTEVHDYYAQWKDRTKLRTGGLGFGLERLVRFCAGASSVLELRFAHDQGPNATIDVEQALCA